MRDDEFDDEFDPDEEPELDDEKLEERLAIALLACCSWASVCSMAANSVRSCCCLVFIALVSWVCCACSDVNCVVNPVSIVVNRPVCGSVSWFRSPSSCEAMPRETLTLA